MWMFKFNEKNPHILKQFNAMLINVFYKILTQEG